MSIPPAEYLAAEAARHNAIENAPAVLDIDGRLTTYPRDHIAGTVVPKGGSCCANCRFSGTGDDGVPVCREENFVRAELPNKPAGIATLPAPPDEYCSDWWRSSIETPPLPTEPGVPPLDVTFTP